MMAEEETGRAVDARIVKTKARVIEVARQLLAEVGPTRLTYTLIGERAKVTRQTLYRHWPTREQLLADLVLNGPDVGYPSGHGDLEHIACEFLFSVRAGMADAVTAAGLTALIAQADRDPGSSDTLAAIVQDRRAALNALLQHHGEVVGADDFASLIGPLMFTRFISRQPVTDQFLRAHAAHWVGTRRRGSS